MTESDDFEAILRDGMRAATRDVSAPRELQQRLIDTASAAPGPRSVNGSLRSGRFLASWMLPAAAAVITVLVAGSVVAAQQLTSGSSAGSGDSVVPPAVSSSAPQPAVSTAPSAPSASPSATVHPVAPRNSTSAPRTHAASSAPVSNSSVSSTSVTQSSPTVTRSSTPTGRRSAPGKSPAFPPACSVPGTGEYGPTSLQDFEKHMIGTWLVCSEPSIFGDPDAGLRISADGTWAELSRNAAGQLVSGTGSLRSGTWVAIDDSAMNGRPAFQINLHIHGSGTVIADAVISSGVTRVRLDNNGSYQASYVPTTERVH